MCQQPTGRLVLQPINQRLGHTFPFQDNLYQTLTQPGARSCYCIQLSLDKRGYRAQRIDDSDKARVERLCRDRNKTFAIHCSYLANLSYPATDPRTAKSIHHVKAMIHNVTGLPGTCVLHIGKVGSIEQVADNVNQLVIPRATVPQLLLENAAGQGTELGTNWDELRRLFEAIDTSKVGLCLDTQHAFGSGLCNFDGHEAVIKMLDQADNCGKLGLIHLNDSKTPFGSRVDRHESLRRGYIWTHQDESLRTILDYAYDQAIDVVLETPSYEDLDLLTSQYTHPILI